MIKKCALFDQKLIDVSGCQRIKYFWATFALDSGPDLCIVTRCRVRVGPSRGTATFGMHGAKKMSLPKMPNRKITENRHERNRETAGKSVAVTAREALTSDQT